MNRREVLSSATLMAAGIAGSQVISAAANAGTDGAKKTAWPANVMWLSYDTRGVERARRTSAPGARGESLD